MKKILILCLLFSTFGLSKLYAQDFGFGKLSQDDIKLSHVGFDSAAHAVVLREFGTAAIRIDDQTGQSYIDYEYHVKIKILDKQGYEEANVQIPLWSYGSGDRKDELVSISGITINHVAGDIQTTSLDQKMVFTDQKSKYPSSKKFTMPSIQTGSIIEYQYRIKRPYLFNFITWEFQRSIPKLYSEFIGFIPPIYNFNASIRGFYKLSDQKAEVSRGCLRVGGTDIDCSKMTYIMRDIPAFIEEDYMTAAMNFKSAIYFELSDIQHLGGGTSKITKTWKSVDYELTGDKSFGGQMKKKDLFVPLLPEVLKNSEDELAKAKAIYSYIKQQIKWNRYLGKYSENEIKKALAQHSGNIGDINLALIAALSAAGLDAEALILSTRDNGTVNNLYPVISDFNYVVAKVNIEGISYLLDASEENLPFGLLPLRCMNAKGRVINLKKESYWYTIIASQKDVNNYVLNGDLTTDGKIRGTLTIVSNGYTAFNKRNRIAEAGTVEAYTEKLDESLPSLKFLNAEVTNVANLEDQLVEVYKIEMDLGGDINADQYYLNPYLIDKLAKNPFNLSERLYPVDLGATSEHKLIMNLNVPTNLTLIEKPKDVKMALPDAAARYANLITFEPGKLNFSQLLQINKPVFESEEYFSLKEFYSRIIQQQKTDLILRKTN